MNDAPEGTLPSPAEQLTAFVVEHATNILRSVTDSVISEGELIDRIGQAVSEAGQTHTRPELTAALRSGRIPRRKRWTTDFYGRLGAPGFDLPTADEVASHTDATTGPDLAAYFASAYGLLPGTARDVAEVWSAVYVPPGESELTPEDRATTSQDAGCVIADVPCVRCDALPKLSVCDHATPGLVPPRWLVWRDNIHDGVCAMCREAVFGLRRWTPHPHPLPPDPAEALRPSLGPEPQPLRPAAPEATDKTRPTPSRAAGSAIEIADDPAMREEVRKETRRVVARQRAREALDAAEFDAPEARESLAADLAADLPPPTWLINEVFAEQSNGLLAAKFKAGKTTWLLNLTKSLVDGTPFLGRFPSRGGLCVAYLNFEVGERQFIAWCRDVGIQRPEYVRVFNLRGMRVPLWTRVGKEWAVDAFAGFHVLIIDPFGAAFNGAGEENSNTDVRKYLAAIDEISRGAELLGTLIATHFGRNREEERARGATVIDDWPDARYVLTREDGAPAYFKASGRDVDVPELRLDFDPVTRALTAVGGSRADDRIDQVVNVVIMNPGANKSRIAEILGGNKQRAMEDINAAITAERIRLERDGPSHLLYPATDSPSSGASD